MTDDELDRLLRDAARTYRRPPDLADTDALWTDVERALDAAPALTVVRGDDVAPVRHRTWWASPWLRTAAVLLLGVAIGRLSTRVSARAAVAPSVAVAPNATVPNATVPNVVPVRDVATHEYLGRAAVLLAALPDELRSRRSDPAYLSQADALLLQTRLLLDSPAAADPALRALLEDLELVLAQVVRLDAARDSMNVDFLQQALQQRDVLPRLRDAVADKAAAD